MGAYFLEVQKVTMIEIHKMKHILPSHRSRDRNCILLTIFVVLLDAWTSPALAKLSSSYQHYILWCHLFVEADRNLIKEWDVPSLILPERYWLHETINLTKYLSLNYMFYPKNTMSTKLFTAVRCPLVMSKYFPMDTIHIVGLWQPISLPK